MAGVNTPLYSWEALTWWSGRGGFGSWRATWECVLSIIKTHTLCYLCVGPLWKRDAASQTAIQNEIENCSKTAIKQTQKLRIWCLLRIALQLFKIIIIILIGQLLPAATAPFISCSSDLKGENNYIILIKKIEEKRGATVRYECICTDPCHSVARPLGHQVKRLHLLNLNIKVRLLSFFFYSRKKLGSLPSPGAPPSDRGPSVSELCVVLFLFSFPKSHWLRLCGAAGRGAGPPHMMLHFILPTLSDSGTSPACQWTPQKTKTGPPWVGVVQNTFTWAPFASGWTCKINPTDSGNASHASPRVCCISSLTVYPVLKAQFIEFYTERKTIALLIRSFMYIYK